MSQPHDYFYSSWRAFIGIFSPLIAVVVSNLDAIEQYLRVASLLLGMCVALVSLALGIISLVRKLRRPIDEDDDPDPDLEGG